MELLTRLGLTRVYSCWWFTALLCTLAASLSICTWRRAKMLGRTRGTPRLRVAGSVVTHVSILLILFGAVIRGIWGQKGYLELREGQTADSFALPDDSVKLPFAVHLVDFEVEFYGEEERADPPAANIGKGKLIVRWAEKHLSSDFPVEPEAEYVFGPPGESAQSSNLFRITVARYVPDFVIDVSTREVLSRSDEPRNPAIAVSVAGHASTNIYWLFAKYPQFNTHTGPKPGADMPLHLGYESDFIPDESEQPGNPVKDYKSTLQVLERGRVVREKVVEVNAPLSHKGYTFYQSSYNPQDLTWTLLQVVHDPGVPVVYVGFAFMIVGLTIVFYVCPWMETRRKQSGGTP
jgi:hypothetical protein